MLCFRNVWTKSFLEKRTSWRKHSAETVKKQNTPTFVKHERAIIGMNKGGRNRNDNVRQWFPNPWS